MKFSEQWLRTWTDPQISTQQLVDQLTSAGLEVDSHEAIGGPVEKVVVGSVLSVDAHPRADRLRVCRVDVADGADLEIVCGAANVASGQKVPVVLVGGKLASGMKIKKTKLRGVVSQGMICSAAELGLEVSSEGIMVLDGQAPVGTPIDQVLNLDDVAIDVDLTPNRGDCLCIQGIAREVGVLNRSPVQGPELAPVPACIDDTFPVYLDAPRDCPRYAGRIIRDVDMAARSPQWMVDRLAHSGVRSINVPVDVTNYVMLELGQPMHAFDLHRLTGAIHVRRARAAETLVLLDGTELHLDADALVIADEARALALAGIMGGEQSGVYDNTQDLFLESAFFSPTMLLGEARRFSLHTDSSHRFERGVDPTGQARAVERASQLILDIMGGSPGPVAVAEQPDKAPQLPEVILRPERLRRLLGVDVDRDRVEDILTRLEMVLSWQNGFWTVTPPAHRFDIAIEADLIEEIARVVGYDEIPEARPKSVLVIGAQTETKVSMDRVRSLFVSRGYQEVVNYSFVDPALQELTTSRDIAVTLSNPIASDMSEMRTNLWTGMLQTVARNVNRQQPRVRVFETGLVFQQLRALQQQGRIAAAVTGSARPVQWGSQGRPVDFFDLKGDVEALLGLTGRPPADFTFVSAEQRALHPGRSAKIRFQGEGVGWLGMVHPKVATAHGLSDPVYVFELEASLFEVGLLPKFAPISRFPSVRRDIAVVVDEGIEAAQVRDCVGHSVGDMLKNLELFDVYRGEGVDSGRKSLAMALTFQTDSGTLGEREIETVMGRVVADLRDRLNGELRG